MDEHRARLRLLLATALLRRGDHPARIAATTGVPLALIELIADAHRPTPATSDAAASARAFLQAKLRDAERARRHRMRGIALIMSAAVLNIAASIVSVTWRIPALGAVATLGSFLLIATVSVRARRGTRKPPDRSGPPP